MPTEPIPLPSWAAAASKSKSNPPERPAQVCECFLGLPPDSSNWLGVCPFGPPRPPEGVSGRGGFVAHRVLSATIGVAHDLFWGARARGVIFVPEAELRLRAIRRLASPLGDRRPAHVGPRSSESKREPAVPCLADAAKSRATYHPATHGRGARCRVCFAARRRGWPRQSLLFAALGKWCGSPTSM